MNDNQESKRLKDVLNNYCQGVEKIYKKIIIPQKPFGDKDINAIEHKLGFKLNEELKEWFCIIGEAKYGIDGFLMGMEPYSINEMYDEWESWRRFDIDEELNNPRYYSSYPLRKIKCRYTNPKWIPLGHTYDSNYIGVDLDPDIEGKIGQIIDFGRDQNAKSVLANSITDYLQKMIMLQEQMCIIKEDNSNYYINKQEMHAIDWVKEILELSY